MTDALWSPSDLIAGLGGTVVSAFPLAATGVSIDSRTLQPNDVFIALSGPNHDGHDHVRSALLRGCAAAVVSRVPEGVLDSDRLILVDDTQAALESLAAESRARTKARIIAITGSVGKTTTKEMLALVLSDQKPTHYSVGSYNNHWGVPLSLARMPRDSAYAVFEVGMNHPREITPLVRQIRPDIAIVTTVEPVHLEFFRNVAAIADAKAEIFDGLPDNGTAVLNRDNQWFERLAGAAVRRGVPHILSFGEAAASQVRLMSIDLADESSTVTVRIAGKTQSYTLNQPGRHIALNSLAVLATVLALGADMTETLASLGRFKGIDGRGKRVQITLDTGTATLLDESYNASPASIRAAFAVLDRVVPEAGGRRIAVLGDMRELGDQGPALHHDLAEYAAETAIDLVYTCGPLMRHLHNSLPLAMQGGWAENSATLLPILTPALHHGDVVMVKGSLGSKMAEIVKTLIAGPSPDLSTADQDL